MSTPTVVAELRDSLVREATEGLQPDQAERVTELIDEDIASRREAARRRAENVRRTYSIEPSSAG